jgi:hypothetical protein
MLAILSLLLFALSFALGCLFFAAAGLPPLFGGFLLTLAALLSPLFRLPFALRAGLYPEVWTGEMIKAFRNSAESLGWINRIRDYSRYAENDAIHFVHIGGDPEVLINNYTYPLSIQNLPDADKIIQIEKFETLPTRITDDELYAISYDKMSSVVERHRESLDYKMFTRALFNLAPAADAAATPIMLTDGANSNDNLRRAFTRASVIRMKDRFDKLRIPLAGRILVLCSDHVNDLLAEDQKFADQYYNYTSGRIANLYGFELYEYSESPFYAVAAKTKKPFGSTPAAGDRQASVAFYAPRMMKASGTTLAYLSAARDNPTTKENLLSYTTRFICLPLKNEAMGVIVSGIPA